MNDIDYLGNILILGSSNVGKKSLLNKLTKSNKKFELLILIN